MSDLLNWDIQEDKKNIRDGAIELQSLVHKRWYNHVGPDYITRSKTYWRHQSLNKFMLFLGRPVYGKVLEIGAGTAWCSAVLSFAPEVTHIHALDYDPYAVSELMPQVFKRFQANTEKITRILGSFNVIKEKESYDFIISMGALHHSENLTSTLKAAYDSLKPGGYLFASEPCEYNNFSQKNQKQKEEKIDPKSQEKYGKITQHKDNSDHYYRICEFEAAAFHVGFDVWPYLFSLEGNKKASDQDFIEKKTYNGFTPNVLFPYYSINPEKPEFDSLTLILQKPSYE